MCIQLIVYDQMTDTEYCTINVWIKMRVNDIFLSNKFSNNTSSGTA